jgi:cysteinyl-tRNA synthetase
MTVEIHDSLARKVVPLSPREGNHLRMYVCGPTVYNYVHIGNARTFVWFDAIRRYLVYRGFDVTFVMNYTDVDDKIIERAKIEELPADGITGKYARAFEEDMEDLRFQPADILVRATDHIEDMVEAIEKLVGNGSAYEAEGDVYFAVEKFEGYGQLSGRSLEEMRAGERVEPQAHKRNPLDFALWKSAKEGEPSWPSPWGPGRPGWHIECSVMSEKYLGANFDVHGGGSDLIFPHHENEIAQAEAIHPGESFVRHWMHAGMVQMGSEKMSKSLGNIVLARDAVAELGGEPVRYWALMSSYRSQSVFSDEALEDAVQSYERWRTLLHAARHALGDSMPKRSQYRRPASDEIDNAFVRRFVEAMDDDFNSAAAFAVVHDLVGEANRELEGAQRGEGDSEAKLVPLVATFLELTSVLGFDLPSGEGSDELTSHLIDYLLELRELARAEKAFERADAIRTQLIDLGVIVEDTPAGPRWRLGRAQSAART